MRSAESDMAVRTHQIKRGLGNVCTRQFHIIDWSVGMP